MKIPDTIDSRGRIRLNDIEEGLETRKRVKVFIDEHKRIEFPFKQWETVENYWSSIHLPGYKYSEKRNAWWKSKFE